MKVFLALLACAALGLIEARAQSVTVELLLDQEQYIANEDLEVRVRITNFSGQPLTFATESDWLSFNIEGSANKVVSQRALVEAIGEFKLDSSTIGTRRVNITPFFDLARPGRYTITANVRVPQLNTRIPSRTKSFNIITGTVLWQQDFGVPTESKTTNAPLEIRKYSLLQVSQQKDLMLYFRLTDATGGHSFRVFPIGNLISFSNPEGQLDRFNNLHVLYQMSARSFLYTSINPEGVMLARETHDISTSRPSLHGEKDGRITVTGGSRRPAANDVPPVSEFDTSANATPKPPEP